MQKCFLEITNPPPPTRNRGGGGGGGGGSLTEETFQPPPHFLKEFFCMGIYLPLLREKEDSMETKLGGLTQEVKKKSSSNFLLPERIPQSEPLIHPIFSFFFFFLFLRYAKIVYKFFVQICVQIWTQFSLHSVSLFGASLFHKTMN